MAEPVVLSGSSLATYLRCGLWWEYQYVRRVRAIPSVKQVLGISTHKAIEVNLEQKISTRLDLPTEDVLAAYGDSYDRDIIEVEKPEEDAGKAKDQGYELVATYQKMVAPDLQPALVEAEVKFEINGIPWSGYIDMVDENRVVRDAKTTARAPSPQKFFLPMVGYALGYRHLTGEKETAIQLDYLVRRKTQPYVRANSGGPVNDEDISTFTEVVERAADGIAAGAFIPNGLYNGACNYCPYRFVCPAVRRGGP